LDLTGLASRIYEAVINIDSGRKGFAIIGKERAGRINYELGIARAMAAFREAQAAADPHLIILAEYTFITQEFQLCDKTDKDTINSLTQAIQSFSDAFLALKAVEGAHYEAAEQIFPHSRRYRVHGYPKDALHIACIAHRARLKNILRAPGLDPMEKALLQQRFANLAAAQGGYMEKQKKALAASRQ